MGLGLRNYSDMHLLSRSVSNTSLRAHSFSLSFALIPSISASSSSFSSKCRAEPISVPSQPPPVSKRVPFTLSLHGHSWQDPCHWMRNTNDPDFLNYLNQENSYAQAFMADTGSLQRTLVAEMKNRMPSKVSTPVECFGPWLYYEYIPEGKEYPVLCRRLQTNKPGWAEKILSYVKAEFRREEILLDWNEVAEKHGYVHVGQCRISPDHNFLAYTLDATGSEQFMLQIKDLRNGCIIPMAPENGIVSLAWAQDCKTLFYTIADENQRPYRVLCTKLEPGNTDDTLVFMENDPSYCVDLTSTKDGKFITVNSNSRSSSEEGLCCRCN
ncbi:hypothetical protein ES332_A12G183500v1 [Gossypium tomentosum]|uniref:Peptidase S9A N-terminal domain-containing protein n=1 Tax=Gossypium tomentosum TaxID=34277 RepID=A0A5D2MZ44_GOSTO|nr:hypothetical protein ES332_A12G183500v1 [Gossypium tomentosum]